MDNSTKLLICIEVMDNLVMQDTTKYKGASADITDKMRKYIRARVEKLEIKYSNYDFEQIDRYTSQIMRLLEDMEINPLPKDTLLEQTELEFPS